MSEQMFSLGTPVVIIYKNQPGSITGYMLRNERYEVTLEDGSIKYVSWASLRRAQPPLTGDELLDEVEFLLDQGQSPLMVPHLIGRNPATVVRIARENKRVRVTEAFVAAGEAEWDRKFMRGFRA